MHLVQAKVIAWTATSPDFVSKVGRHSPPFLTSFACIPSFLLHKIVLF
jgi:hypothetical protein